MRTTLAVSAFILFAVHGGAAVRAQSQPPSPPTPTNTDPPAATAPTERATEPVGDDAALKEIFPGVFLDESRKIIELPGRVPIMADVGDETVVFLEQLVCTPNTKEHESLVVVKARPSHVHAALLLLGLEPGKPASWTVENETLIPHAPEGPPLIVEFLFTDAAGVEQTAKPSDWVVNFKNTAEHLPDERPVFAGSAMKKLRDGSERYYADGDGTLIGLASFCTEVIAWPRVFSHEASRHEPEWVAAKDMPKLDTAVRVCICLPPADPPAETDGVDPQPSEKTPAP